LPPAIEEVHRKRCLARPGRHPLNLTRVTANVSGPSLAKATTATIGRKLITVHARIASAASRLKLHLTTGWPWQDAWPELFTRTCGPPRTATP
jgi:hypothetical protein